MQFFNCRIIHLHNKKLGLHVYMFKQMQYHLVPNIHVVCKTILYLYITTKIPSFLRLMKHPILVVYSFTFSISYL